MLFNLFKYDVKGIDQDW